MEIPLVRDFISLIFPECCLGCSEVLVKNEELICTNCRASLPRTELHLEKSNKMQKRFYGKVPIRHAFAYLSYTKGGKVRNAIHALKYRGDQEMGRTFGRWYGADLAESGYLGVFDALVPVPLHITRLRQRGYNQAAVFAEGLGQSLGIPVWPNALIRKQATATQTRKHRFARWKNVTEVFDVLDKSVMGINVLLTDDVVTTGSTIEACAAELLKAGAASVSVAAIALAN
jgi:ComF family protein